jgi:AcrR family transcriptional regulator
VTALQVSKGDATRAAVLDRALNLASELGLEGLTIGVLAEKVGLSKSGLYAHFASKEQLQVDVLDTAKARFVDKVIQPALAQPRGLPRVVTLFERWLVWDDSELDGGCPWIAASSEYDDRPGPVRDVLVAHMEEILAFVARAASIAKDEGHFRADLDVEQFAYDYWGVVLAHHHYRRLLEAPTTRKRTETAIATLLERARA